MKKIAVGILTAALTLGIGIMSAFAAGPGCHFTDGNGDGICDHAHQSCAFVDEDGDGICDNCGAGSGRNGGGRNYTDQDEDGVCDNYEADSHHRSGRGYGHGGRRGCGR